MVVEQELQKLGINGGKVTLGEVETATEIPKNKLEKLRNNLTAVGFELLGNSKQQLIEKIKNIIVKRVHYSEEEKQYNLSGILSKTLHKDYSYLSGLFSEVEGVTIEKYIINQKIEKVKELIIYDELNITEIAWKMNYSSVAHLSNQFKKVTGLTPSHFRQLKDKRRSSIEDIGVVPKVFGTNGIN